MKNSNNLDWLVAFPHSALCFTNKRVWEGLAGPNLISRDGKNNYAITRLRESTTSITFGKKHT